MLVNSRTFASQAKIRIFASQVTSVYPKKCPRFKPRWLAKSTIWLITTFVFHYHFELLIQQLFKRVSNISLLWTADSLCHAPWVHLSIDCPTHWGISAPSSNHVRVRLTSDPFHTFKNLLHPKVGSLMYNMYLSVPLPAMAGWLFRTLLNNVDAPGDQTIQNWNPGRSFNIEHAAGNLRVIYLWRTYIGPWVINIL
jgi:hypothetical protein